MPKTFHIPTYPAGITNTKIEQCFASFQSLLAQAEQKVVNRSTASKINEKIDELNQQQADEKKYYSKLSKTQRETVNILAKEAKLTPRDYYRTLWTALGMPAFGLPLGTGISLSLNNLAFMAIGLPFGFAIGLAIGTYMDKDAAAKGRLLDTEIKFK